MSRALKESTFHRYTIAIRSMPKEVWSFQLLLVVFTYSLAGSPKGKPLHVVLTDGEAGTRARLLLSPNCQAFFNLLDFLPVMRSIMQTSSPTVSVFIGPAYDSVVSFVNLGAGIGPLLTLPLNDWIGRVWSYRLWMTVYAIGIAIETAAKGNLGALYAGRIIAGFGIGALTVVGPMSIAE